MVNFPLSIHQTYQMLANHLFHDGIEPFRESHNALIRGENSHFEAVQYSNLQNAFSLLTPLAQHQEDEKGFRWYLSSDEHPYLRPFDFHTLDFDDFLDFATSSICPTFSNLKLKDTCLAYEALPGTSTRTKFRSASIPAQAFFVPHQVLIAPTRDGVMVYLSARVEDPQGHEIKLHDEVLPMAHVSVEFRIKPPGATLLFLKFSQPPGATLLVLKFKRVEGRMKFNPVFRLLGEARDEAS